MIGDLAKDSDVRVIGTMRRRLLADERFPDNVSVIDECDLTQPSSCARIADAVSKTFTSPFGFIHSVGEFWEHTPFLSNTPDAARGMFESHVITLYNALHALIPVMQSKGGGSSIVFSCNSVRYNYPWMAPFTASKSAIDSLVRSLANEFSAYNLRFNSLALASLQTPKVLNSKPHGDHSHFIPPHDLVPIIRFLLSEASYLVNGNTINLFVHSDEFFESGYFKRISK